MTYTNKPKHVRYVDMAIWIDNNAYKENCDHTKLYDYLYHISKMLAYKRGLCKTSQEYEDFAIYAASRYFFRLTNSRQFDEIEPLEKIKSILNYIKRTLYPTKIEYDREYTNQVIDDREVDYDSVLHNIMQTSISELRVSEFKYYLQDIKKTIRAYLSHIPYRVGTAEWENIYLSCLLSLLSSITLSRDSMARVKHFAKNAKLNAELVDKIYKKERENSTILYHLPDSMHDYITVLVNSIRKVIANDLSGLLHSDITSESCIKSTIVSSISNEGDSYED